jgi:DNA-directed RNA polymerase
MKKLRDEFLERYARNKVPVKVVLSKQEDLQAWKEHLRMTGRETLAKQIVVADSRSMEDVNMCDVDNGELNNGQVGVGGKKKMKKRTSQRIVSAWVDFNLPALPPRGDFDVSIVKESPYFFS